MGIISFQCRKKYARIEWEEDKSLSVVSCEKLNEGLRTVGKVSTVKTSDGFFVGLVTATGV